MQSSLYIGATGLKTHSTGLQTLSNNLANVSTVGYKQQSVLFEDLMYQQKPPMGSAWPQVWNQSGMGTMTGAVRTLFTVNGSFEPTNSVTDLALDGRGFFQVTRDDKIHYTRAGNFHWDNQGILKDSNDFALTGLRVTDGQEEANLSPVQLNLSDNGYEQNGAKATDAVNAFFNLGFRDDKTSSYRENPAFNLLLSWNGTQEPPLENSQVGYSQSMRLYDANGVTRSATIYFDTTNLGTGSDSIYEYIVASAPEADGSAAAGTQGAGLLLAGTLTFSSSGELKDMSAFSPGGGNYKDLSNWTPSPLVNGLPQINMQTADGQNLNFTLNLGINSPNGWESNITSAADVGTNVDNLPSMGQIGTENNATTNYGTSSSSKRYSQTGYGIGFLTGLDINKSGELLASYSNGQEAVLYRIPVFRFTSEDGLYREGMNHYSWRPESGNIEYGTAGTENYGKINSRTLETSNVDMTREMTMMIIMQRGFQMNSKSITTSDAMLQRALELKR